MTYKQKLEKLANDNDIDLDISRENIDKALDISAWAPDGKKFATGTHCVVIADGENTAEFINTWKTALEGLIHDIGTGLINCNDDDCDVCSSAAGE